MPTCDCGRETSRLTTFFTSGGAALAEPCTICPYCRPESFRGFRDPSNPDNRRLHAGFEVFPNEYEKREDSEGRTVYLQKDWAKGEQEREIREGGEDAKAVLAEAIEKKRAYARTHQRLSPEQVQRALRQGEQVAAQSRMLGEGWALPE